MKQEYQLYIAAFRIITKSVYRSHEGYDIIHRIVAGKNYQEAKREAKRIMPKIKKSFSGRNPLEFDPSLISLRKSRVGGFKVRVEPLEKRV